MNNNQVVDAVNNVGDVDPDLAFQKKSSRNVWLIAAGAGVLIVAVISIFLFIFLSSGGENDISGGINLEIEEGEEITFVIGDEEHTLTVDSVSDTSVNLIIESNPIQFDIDVGEEKKFDLDSDDFYDIEIKLKAITDGVPEIYMKEIHESIDSSGDDILCTESWNCESWSNCTSGNQTRACTDSSSCGTTIDKPEVIQSCNCAVNWTCNAWDSCIDDIQTRICRDKNLCGDDTSMPNITQSCTCSEDWECSDWGTCLNENQTRTCSDENDCGTKLDKPNLTQSCSVDVVDCGIGDALQEGDESDCFVSASVVCEPAEMMSENSIDFLGIIINATTQMEINTSLEAGNCTYYQIIEDYSIEYSEALKQQLIAGGDSSEEVDIQEAAAQVDAQALIGSEKTCTFVMADLTAILTNWQGGIVSADDFDVATCVDGP
ncbi:hypothetical protein KAR91_59500 [Candidatus Pacearchaeota archaeon]|nr:hypothetical protein [Candidatus Pacearchaeota archaeon]